MLAYFQRDKLDSAISAAILVIEQSDDGQPFNAGKLKNVGFDIAQANCDYFCFHDVDYLPIWADYSYPSTPARLIWDGLRNKENYAEFFGAVVMFNRADFLRVNGFSNQYVGWGFEDTDLLLRCRAMGLAIEHRDGTFNSLAHADRGFNSDGTPSAESLKNRAVFEAKVAELRRTGTIPDDGLRDLRYQIDGKTDIGPNVRLHRVII